MSQRASAQNRDGKRRRATAPAHGRDLPVCPVTGKMSYASRAKARKGGLGGAKSKNVYKCPHCPYWHRTKKR